MFGRGPRFPKPENEKEVSGLVVRAGGDRPPKTGKRGGEHEGGPPAEDQPRPPHKTVILDDLRRLTVNLRPSTM